MNTYKTLEFRFSESRGRGTWGYNICSLLVDGRKVSSCKGGGYDMQGESLGDWVAREYADRLMRLKNSCFYGLTFHGNSASSKFPTRLHRRPLIHGACGLESVRRIMQAIKLEMEYITKSSNATIYRLHDRRRRTRSKGTK